MSVFLSCVVQAKGGDEVGCFPDLVKEVLTECPCESLLEARRELTNDGKRTLEQLDVVDEARLIPSEYGDAGDRLASADGIPFKVSLHTVNRLRSEHELFVHRTRRGKECPDQCRADHGLAEG